MSEQFKDNLIGVAILAFMPFVAALAFGGWL